MITTPDEEYESTYSTIFLQISYNNKIMKE